MSTQIMSASDLLKQSGGGDFLSSEEKEALCASAAPFYIVDAEPNSDTRFGPQTKFYIRSKDAFGDEQRILAFTHNKFREDLAKNIVKALANGVAAAGPFYLGKFQTNSGHTAWDLLAEAPKGDAEGKAKPVEKAAANEPKSDPDLPF